MKQVEKDFEDLDKMVKNYFLGFTQSEYAHKEEILQKRAKLIQAAYEAFLPSYHEADEEEHYYDAEQLCSKTE